MNPISISINPTYLCNLRCEFCYLTPKQLGDNNTLSLVDLSKRLREITEHTDIEHIDLYGGEVTTLSPDYINDMFDVIQTYYQGPVNVITNLTRPLSKTQWLFEQESVVLSVSWDYTCRESWDSVMKNIAMSPKPVHVLLLASKCMVKWSDAEIGAAQMILHSLCNVTSVEIKPYSTNQANQYDVPFDEFEKFIQRWYDIQELIPLKPHYEFVNDNLIRSSLDKTRNAWSDDHVYITPNGNFGVLEFDDHDHEYFMELNTFGKYIKWAEQEKQNVSANDICKECQYLGHCLSEHLRPVNDLEHSCNGFKGLLDWYANRS